VTRSYDTVVIGAGPAGLATSRELAREKVDHVVLERGNSVGHTWANLYDSLVLHTGKHLSSLPGMRFPRETPLFPSRIAFLDYLHRYAAEFRLPIALNANVTGASRADGAWTVTTAQGDVFQARRLVIATGIVANPHVAEIRGRERFRGAVTHSVEYRRPEPFKGQRVLVVGVGNSAGEIAAELAAAGVDVTISVRSGARCVPRQLFGVPIQYLAAGLHVLPRRAHPAIVHGMARMSEWVRGRAVLPRPREGRCTEIPLIGFHLVDAIRSGAIRVKGAIAELTDNGARFEDGGDESFDRILLATGYRAALGVLASQVHLDDCGFASRRDRVVSRDQPDLYFVGHNQDMRGGLMNIALDARLVARRITEPR
jgi:NADPH-dependent 2,4-dienoyl-CoA reductase/sulfur reductase-like enzyme